MPEVVHTIVRVERTTGSKQIVTANHFIKHYRANCTSFCLPFILRVQSLFIKMSQARVTASPPINRSNYTTPTRVNCALLSASARAAAASVANGETPAPASDDEALASVSKPADHVWSVAFRGLQPHRDKSSTCTFCDKVVKHTGHVSYVKAHLNTCKPFNAFMEDTDPEDHPAWFSPNCKKAKHQTTMWNHHCPPMKDDEQVVAKEKAALFVYMTGSPFSLVNAPTFRDFAASLRSDVKLPNRKAIGGTLLDECYTNTKERLNTVLSNNKSRMVIVSDGWSNCKRTPQLNYLLVVEGGVEHYINTSFDV